MQALSFSGDIAHSANVHLSILDAFIAVVQRKISETATPFACDSLSDMLADLVEQRGAYLAVTMPTAIAA